MRAYALAWMYEIVHILFATPVLEPGEDTDNAAHIFSMILQFLSVTKFQHEKDNPTTSILADHRQLMTDNVPIDKVWDGFYNCRRLFQALFVSDLLFP
jgi:hypothetical protein